MKRLPNFLLLRLTLGFIFLWTFLDKTFGLGFSTVAEKAWLQGASPTTGFLQFGADGVLSPLFQALAGNVFVDVLFMSGMLLVGLALLLGIGIQIAGYSGSLMMFLIYASVFPPENNPLVDQHVVYILVLLLLAERVRTGKSVGSFGLGEWWSKQQIVQRWEFLR